MNEEKIMNNNISNYCKNCLSAGTDAFSGLNIKINKFSNYHSEIQTNIEKKKN